MAHKTCLRRGGIRGTRARGAVTSSDVAIVNRARPSKHADTISRRVVAAAATAFPKISPRFPAKVVSRRIDAMYIYIYTSPVCLARRDAHAWTLPGTRIRRNHLGFLGMNEEEDRERYISNKQSLISNVPSNLSSRESLSISSEDLSLPRMLIRTRVYNGQLQMQRYKL